MTSQKPSQLPRFPDNTTLPEGSGLDGSKPSYPAVIVSLLTLLTSKELSDGAKIQLIQHTTTKACQANGIKVLP
jgi:hypothetical protein